MSRLVRKPRLSDLEAHIAGLDIVGGAQAAVSEPSNSYLERIAKYIPAEVLGFFMLINAILDQAAKSGGPNAAMAGFPVSSIAVCALIAGCIVTPIFCWYVREDGDAWICNAIVSTVAFPFWAYLMGAVAFAEYHDGNLAVILVLTFTMISGLISPPPPYRVTEQADAVAEAAVSEDTTRLVEALA
jgi:hypothetical protein